MANKPNIMQKEIAFNGKLRTYEDAASIGPNDFAALTNLRYTYTHPKSIYGMSSITSSGVPQNIGSMVHFRRGQPSESHVLVHAVSAIYDMTAAIPATGSFGSALWNDTAAGASAKFAYANGLLVYANGVGDTCVYGGDEFRCGGFIVQTSAAKYDYTDAVNNTSLALEDLATLKTYQMSADANTMALLHLDNNVTDSAIGNTFTASGMTYSTSIKKFGTHGAIFNASAAIYTADATAFDFSGGTWTIDTWLRPNTDTDGRVIYYQGTDAGNYMKITDEVTDIGGYFYHFPTLTIASASASVVSVTPSERILVNQWSHLEVTENGNDYRIFINGAQCGYSSATGRAQNFTGAVFIGCDSASANYFSGYMDEFRISDSARHTASFPVPTTPYGNNYVTDVYLGSIMPLSGAKLYVSGSQSNKEVTFSLNEWDGNQWSVVTTSPTSAAFADGTAVSLTWANTANTSKVREIEKSIMYWYQLTMYDETDFNGVTVSRCTTKLPFQQVKDFWGGDPMPLGAFLVYNNASFNDYTNHVASDEYDSANEGSYAKIGGLAASAEYFVLGTPERLMGAYLQFAGEYVNKTALNVSVAYYNGNGSVDDTSSWTNLPGTIDGTKNDTYGLNKSGFITWSSPAANLEFKSAGWTSQFKFITGGTEDENGENFRNTFGTAFGRSNTKYPLYYYKFTIDGTTSADVRVVYAYGIPAQKTIRGFKFPVVHQDRLWLCSDTTGEKNYVLCSAYQSPTVLGFGDDNAEFWLGDDTEVVAGASLFTRYGSTVADVLVLCKQHETYVIDGDNPENYKQRCISEHIGCIAPQSMVVVPMGEEAIPGTPRNIAVWVSQQGVVAFDGNNFVLISEDIKDKFEPTNANYIGSTIKTCTAFYDSTYGEYVLVVPGSAEYRYDVARKKWFTVDRDSYPLRCGAAVYDVNGLAYNFGAAGTKLYRLDNGSTMAGDAFTRTLRTGEMALPEGSVGDYARVNWMMLVGKTQTSAVSAYYYTDTSTATAASAVFDATNSGKRLMNEVEHKKSTQATFHGFEFDTQGSFEPLYLAFRYTIFPREIS